jgi:hypothetical protein
MASNGTIEISEGCARENLEIQREESNRSAIVSEFQPTEPKYQRPVPAGGLEMVVSW